MKKASGLALVILFMFVPALLLISSGYVASAFGCVASAEGGLAGCAYANELAFIFFLASFFSFITMPVGVFIVIAVACAAWAQSRRRPHGRNVRVDEDGGS